MSFDLSMIRKNHSYKSRYDIFGEVLISKYYAKSSKFDNLLFFKNGKVLNIKTTSFIKEQTTQTGYKMMYIKDNDNKGYQMYVHHIMFLVFIGDIKENYEIDHINGVRDDNNINNIQMLSISDNRKKRNLINSQYKECDRDLYEKHIDYHRNRRNKQINN